MRVTLKGVVDHEQDKEHLDEACGEGSERFFIEEGGDHLGKEVELIELRLKGLCGEEHAYLKHVAEHAHHHHPKQEGETDDGELIDAALRDGDHLVNGVVERESATKEGVKDAAHAVKDEAPKEHKVSESHGEHEQRHHILRARDLTTLAIFFSPSLCGVFGFFARVVFSHETSSRFYLELT